MSGLSKQALKVENNQSFPNNNAGLITPSNLRTFNENMIDSTVNQTDYTTDSASFDSRINNITGSATDTGSLLVTASFNNGTRDLTFTKGDSSTFAVNIPDASGSVLPPGVVSGSSQIDYPQISNIPSGIVSGSSQVNLTDTTFVDGTEFMVLRTDGAGNLSFDYADRAQIEIRALETIVKGDPLYVAGFSDGQNRVTVRKADASDPSKMPAYGVAYESVSQNTNTQMVALGTLQDIDTQTPNFNVGDVLYVASGGGLTNVRPEGTNLVQNVGIVGRRNQNNGEIVVSAIGRSNDVPNLPTGFAWVGNGSQVATPISTASWDSNSDLTSLNAFTASQEILNNTFATTGSNNFVGNQDIDGSVTSSISLSNLIANPQTITDNVVVGPDTNGFIVGPTSISGTITVEGDSEVFVFSQPLPPINTGSFATLSSNTFTGGQTINGALTVNGFTSSFDQVKITDVFHVSQSAEKQNRFQFANDGRLDVDWPAGNYFRMQNGAFQFGTNNGIGMFFDYPGIKFQPTGISQNHAMAMSSQPTQFPALNFTQYTGSCAGIIYNQTNSNSSPTYLMVGAKYSSSFDETLYTDLNFFSSGSANISTLKLRQQDPLPAGAVGDLATSGSALYFHDGSSWRTVTLT